MLTLFMGNLILGAALFAENSALGLYCIAYLLSGFQTPMLHKYLIKHYLHIFF
jgi:hypothetical protein